MFKRKREHSVRSLSYVVIWGLLICFILSFSLLAGDKEEYRKKMAENIKMLYGIDRQLVDYEKLEPIVDEFFKRAQKAGFYPGEIIQGVFEHSYDPKYRPQFDHDKLKKMNAGIHKQFQRLSEGVLDYKRISYKSRFDGLEIPAYLFQSLEKRGPKNHPALVWAHGGIAANFSPYSFPFIKQAIERGYVVIAPDYRGSLGWGADLYNAWKGMEYQEDIATAAVFLKDNLPHVDSERVAIMGWSHGGLIALYQSFYYPDLFKCAVSGVPVTNAILATAYRGPAFNMFLSTLPGIGGLPHDSFDAYKKASMIYHIDKLTIPLLVQVATNDQQEIWEQNELFVAMLKMKKPDLAEVHVYHDPPGGHGFANLVDPKTMEMQNTKAQRDAWNHIWTFLEYHLEPYRIR